jgi:hypothetical protein
LSLILYSKTGTPTYQLTFKKNLLGYGREKSSRHQDDTTRQPRRQKTDRCLLSHPTRTPDQRSVKIVQGTRRLEKGEIVQQQTERIAIMV